MSTLRLSWFPAPLPVCQHQFLQDSAHTCAAPPLTGALHGRRVLHHARSLRLHGLGVARDHTARARGASRPTGCGWFLTSAQRAPRRTCHTIWRALCSCTLLAPCDSAPRRARCDSSLEPRVVSLESTRARTRDAPRRRADARAAPHACVHALCVEKRNQKVRTAAERAVVGALRGAACRRALRICGCVGHT